MKSKQVFSSKLRSYPWLVNSKKHILKRHVWGSHMFIIEKLWRNLTFYKIHEHSPLIVNLFWDQPLYYLIRFLQNTNYSNPIDPRTSIRTNYSSIKEKLVYPIDCMFHYNEGWKKNLSLPSIGHQFDHSSWLLFAIPWAVNEQHRTSKKTTGN